jgi:uncharacterized protein (TIGR02996 family)
MEQDRIFLEAIRDDPNDDLHRLAWADWFDDHGQSARADFIRAQVHAARLPEGDPERDRLDDEADDLLGKHEANWTGGMVECGVQEWQWQRGCIERVTVWADTLLTHGERLFDLAPIRSVRLLVETGDGVRLAPLPLLARLEELDLSKDSRDSVHPCIYQRDQPLQMLLASPHLTRLRVLRLRGHGIEGPLLRTMNDTGLLARLEELDLANNKSLGDSAVRRMVETRLDRLGALDIRGTNLTAYGVRNLLQTPSLPALTRLGVNAAILFPNGLTSSAWEREWSSAPQAARMTELRVSNYPLDRTALESVLTWPGLTQLRHLSLERCRLDSQAGEHIAACARLANLRRLDLGNNQLRDTGARALAGSPTLANLTSLHLGSNDIGGPGIRALAASPTLTRLDELDLSDNHVGLDGVAAFGEVETVRRLRWLDLSNNNLNAESVRLLARSRSLSRLRVLRLGNNHLGDKGIRALSNSRHLARLRELYLDSCGLDSDGVEALVESPYLGRVTRLGLRNTFISSLDRERLAVRFGPGAEF